MSNATRIETLGSKAGSFMIHLAHGGLLLTGLVTVAYLAAGYLQHDSVSFSDTGVTSAHAASLSPRREAGAARDVVFDPARPEHGWGKLAPAAIRGWLGGNAVPDLRKHGDVELSDEMRRVRDWVSRRYRVSSVALGPVLAEAESSAREAGLDPLLIVAMMAIESSFNPFAESHMGAQGLMQVIPRWHMDKIGEDAAEDALFDPLLNVQIGTQVLVEGLKRYGTLQAALQYYGGARSDPEARYAKKVLAMKQRITSVARSDGDA